LATVSPSGGSVVDFGAGTGALLRSLAERRPDLTSIAVEPYMEVKDFDGRVVHSLDHLDSRSVDVVSAFEVCEHLSDEELQRFLTDADRVLRDRGRLIVSVPIMIGPVVLLKVANSAWLHRRRSEYAVRELGCALAGRPVQRPSNRGRTHKGFDFREFDRTVQGSFRRSSLDRSPMQRLPWWANSQVFMTYDK
jgi:SAM-dependent methyltransferase